MEVWNGQYDIEAESPQRQKCVFEVKYIGIEDEMFTSTLKGNAFGYANEEDNTFILCKLYEAAKKLEGSDSPKGIILVIDDVAWSRIKFSFFDGDLDWRFYEVHPESPFLKKFKKDFPNVEIDLKETLAKINDYWLFRMTGDLSLIQEDM